MAASRNTFNSLSHCELLEEKALAVLDGDFYFIDLMTTVNLSLNKKLCKSYQGGRFGILKYNIGTFEQILV